MPNESQPTASLPKKQPYNVHPIVAWMAIFNFALIFSLAPSMILAESTTAAMSEGSAAMAMRLPESSKLAYARHLAVQQEGVRPALETKKPELKKETACARSCRTTKADCARNAPGDNVAMHACFETAANCMKACGETVGAAKEQKEMMASDLKAAGEAFKAAQAAARQKRAETLKKAQADFEAEMKAAEAAFKAAKTAASASTSTQ